MNITEEIRIIVWIVLWSVGDKDNCSRQVTNSACFFFFCFNLICFFATFKRASAQRGWFSFIFLAFHGDAEMLKLKKWVTQDIWVLNLWGNIYCGCKSKWNQYSKSSNRGRFHGIVNKPAVNNRGAWHMWICSSSSVQFTGWSMYFLLMSFLRGCARICNFFLTHFFLK